MDDRKCVLWFGKLGSGDILVWELYISIEFSTEQVLKGFNCGIIAEYMHLVLLTKIYLFNCTIRFLDLRSL